MNTETKAETGVMQAVPFFAVANIEESVRFYGADWEPFGFRTKISLALF
jgi:hypothetical protein